MRSSPRRSGSPPSASCPASRVVRTVWRRSARPSSGGSPRRRRRTPPRAPGWSASCSSRTSTSCGGTTSPTTPRRPTSRRTVTWWTSSGHVDGAGCGSASGWRRTVGATGAANFVVQRFLPGREPRGPGMSCTAVRPAMLGVLNELTAAPDRGRRTTAAPRPSGSPASPAPWSTRSICAPSGSAALLPSAHCRGWAADVEVTWFERFGADDALRAVLLDYLGPGVLNVIDEGRAWHVCLNPSEVERYDALGRISERARARCAGSRYSWGARSGSPTVAGSRPWSRASNSGGSPSSRSTPTGRYRDLPAEDRRPRARRPAVAHRRRTARALLQRRGLQLRRAPGTAGGRRGAATLPR